MSSEIGVIITSHNREAYLAEAIESVLSQTLQPHDVIVVDDGSTDESVAVARRYGDRVKVIEQANSGCAVARNTGAAAATGTHLAFLDDDDLWPADSLQRRADTLDADPSVDAIFGGVEQFVSPDIPADKAGAFECPPGVQPARLAGSVLIRRPVFDTLGGFDPSAGLIEMIDFFARFSSAGYVQKEIPDLVLRRRIHGSNMVTSQAEMQRQYLKSLRNKLRRPVS